MTRLDAISNAKEGGSNIISKGWCAKTVYICQDGANTVCNIKCQGMSYQMPEWDHMSGRCQDWMQGGVVSNARVGSYARTVSRLYAGGVISNAREGMCTTNADVLLCGRLAGHVERLLLEPLLVGLKGDQRKRKQGRITETSP